MTDEIPEWIKLAKAARDGMHDYGHQELANMCVADGKIDPGFVRHALDHATEAYEDGSYEDRHHELEDFIAILVLYAIAFGKADQPDVCARLVADHMSNGEFTRYYI